MNTVIEEAYVFLYTSLMLINLPHASITQLMHPNHELIIIIVELKGPLSVSLLFSLSWRKQILCTYQK